MAAVSWRWALTAADRFQRIWGSSTAMARRAIALSPCMEDAGTRVVPNPARTSLNISA
ncbi:MAG: hypothetical protein WAK58_28110 [Trebonia sp.]